MDNENYNPPEEQEAVGAASAAEPAPAPAPAPAPTPAPAPRKPKAGRIIAISVCVFAVAAFALIYLFNAGIIGSPATQKPPEVGGTSEGEPPPANPAKDPINDFAVCPITVTADATSPFGIDDDATFLVRGEGLTEAGIYKTIAFSPENNYRVEPQGDGSFRLEPERLVKNSIVTLSYSNDEGQMVKRWAFQVKNDFTILSTSPRDGTEYAPVTTGVEVRFSQKEIDLDSYKAAFSIQPAVNGTFQQFEDTIVFIPDKLECNVTYQVTVAATAKNLAGETLPEAKVFSFSCVDDSRVFYNAESQFQTFLPDDVHLVQLSVSSKYSGQAVDVTLYRFPSAADYAGQMKAYIDMPIKRNMKIDYTRLEKQFEASIPQMKVNDWGPSYVVFDEPLPMGRYLAECRMGRTDAKCYSFIQVTDTTVFSMGNGAEQLVWVNDASTGEPLAGAEVRFERAGSVILGTTNSEGYIVIDQAGLDPGDALLAVGNGEVAFHTVLNVRDGGNDSMGRYYSYLYTDREIYKPTDVIRVWGIVRPLRASGKPQKATVNVGGYSEPVFIGDDGSYLCEIPVTQLRSSYFDITLELDGERAFSKYIEISDYIKPIYIIDAATDKFLYTDIDSESVNVMIDASFYDGTPARDLPIRARTSSAFSITPAITLDKNGHGALVITNRMPERNWMPSYDFYYYGGDDIEDAYEMMDGMFYFAPRDIALLTEVSYDEGGRPAVAITTRSIDVSGINSYRELYAEGYPENILAGPADASGNLSVEYVYYTKKEQEPYYDFINKTTVRRYSYERHVEQWGSYAFATSGGAYIFDQLPALGMDPTRYSDHYWLTFTYQDARGRATLEHCYVNPGNDDVYQEKTDYKTYYFTDKYNSDIGGGYNSRYYDSFDYSYYWDSGFRYNSEHGVSLLLNENDSPVLMPEGARFLTGLTQEKLLQASVSYTDTIEIPFEEKLIPNAVIAGCYFDGKHVYPIRATSLRYDYNERKLNVDIRAEKDSYQPGETAAFTVTATDLRGAPMENATVSLSVVDEAIFTLAPQSVNILKTLYSPAFEPRVSLYASYTQYNLDLIQAECGEGGGGVAIREDFADTAAFLTAHTGSDGIARFTFKLPDNLTSWRITAQAVNAGLFAGDNTINITTNLPMFLSPVIPEVFLSGDTVGFSARVYGADIDSSAEVAYTAVIAESGIDSKIKPIVINERAGANAYFVFGPLPSGTYEATITAECEGFSDGVKKTFEVLDSHIETWVRKDMSIKDLLVPAKRFPVFIGFYNAEYSVYESVLSDLVFRGNDWRADSRIAATVALEMQEKLSDVSLYTYFGKPNIDDITYSGGVSLGRFTEPDALLTARIAAAAPDYMSNRETVSYFRDIIRNPVATSEQVSAAYMGLAAIGEPVLLDVKGLLEGDTGFDEVDTLRLIAAVALAGDYDAAIGFSSQYISPKLVRDTHGCVFYRISDTNREQENIAATATASITVSILNGSSSQNMARYLRTHKSDYDLTVTEQAVFLRHFRPEVTEEAKISYMTKEGPQEITLGKIGIRYIPFTKEDLDIADIRQLSGNVRARVNYIGSLEELDDAGEALYQVEKTMSPDCVAGDTVTVTVTVKGLTKWSFVMVDDYIPTGMRYADILNEYSYSRDWYFAGHERQNIKFALYSQNGGDITFSYKLRAVTPGEYVVESAAARSFRGGYGISPRGKVTITE